VALDFHSSRPMLIDLPRGGCTCISGGPDTLCEMEISEARREHAARACGSACRCVNGKRKKL
jgi:hypothetical protein